MHSSFALLALATSALAQGVTELIKPDSASPQGCSPTRNGKFQITIMNITQPATTKRDLVRRQESQQVALECTLTDGVLKDAKDRTGYIASNYQFQFDGPPQAGAIYTAGFSVCSNGTIALGGSAVWWQCLSGSFYNLYDRKWAEHCIPCYFEVIGGAGSTSGGSTGSGSSGSTGSGSSGGSSGGSSSGGAGGAGGASGASSGASAGTPGTAAEANTTTTETTTSTPPPPVSTSTAESNATTTSSESPASTSAASTGAETPSTRPTPSDTSDAGRIIPSIMAGLAIALVAAFQI